MEKVSRPPIPHAPHRTLRWACTAEESFRLAHFLSSCCSGKSEKAFSALFPTSLRLAMEKRDVQSVALPSLGVNGVLPCFWVPCFLGPLFPAIASGSFSPRVALTVHVTSPVSGSTQDSKY